MNGPSGGWSLVARLAVLWVWIVVCGVGLGVAAVVGGYAGGWAAVLLATMICGVSASTALAATVLLAKRGDLVTGMLVSTACRTLVPLTAGVVLTLPGSPPAMEAAFGWLVALYLLTLGVEVVLSLPANP